MKKLVIVIFILIILSIFCLIYIGNTCYMGSKSIANSNRLYELIWGDPYGDASLGYAIDNRIDSLKSVRWNDRMIVVEQNIDKENRWAIIKPRWDNDSVLYGTRDTLIRDLTKYQVDSIINFLKPDTFIIEDLKPDIIAKCNY